METANKEIVEKKTYVHDENEKDYATASGLQVEMYDKVEELKALYDAYAKNMI